MNDDAFEPHPMVEEAQDEMTPGNPGFERALAQGQFEFAKTRYIRALTGGVISKVIAAAETERAKLTDEIRNLQVLSRSRYETAIDAARMYGMVLPHRVGKNWLQPPAALERVGEFYGSDRLYKVAAKAAKEFAEAQELLAKKHDKLTKMERDLRLQLDRQEASFQRQLMTTNGLANARLRDPLLDSAYKKLRTIVGEEAAEDAAAGGSSSQFPDEPME